MYKIEDKIHHSDTQMTIKKIPVPLFTYNLKKKFMKTFFM